MRYLIGIGLIIGTTALIMLLSSFGVAWQSQPLTAAQRIDELTKSAYQLGYRLKEAEVCGVANSKVLNIADMLELLKQSQPALAATIDDAVVRGQAEVIANRHHYTEARCIKVIKAIATFDAISSEMKKILERHIRNGDISVLKPSDA